MMKQNNEAINKTLVEPKNTFLEKVKRHKKKIIIGGTLASAIAIGSIIIFKNCNIIKIFADAEIVKPSTTADSQQSMQIIPKTDITEDSHICDLFMVRDHVRNLSENYHASQRQIELAESLNVMLAPNQTYVRSYFKRVS